MNASTAVVGAAIYVLLWAIGLAAWLTAVIVDGSASAWGWLAADILVSPFGVVRGVLMWLGIAG